ncbi:MAG TPA: DUF438 domain-containing protein [Lachnospiraceae bacterium]|nr:DUF438 domain-containing protein [Lachnospiraceae bacterium]
MSEYINNRELRQQTIKEIIRQLHEGKTVEDVKKQFEDVFDGVSANEISEAEGALIAEGLPVSEIQRLCDVHASVFKGSIEEIHQTTDPTLIQGHPINTLLRENREIERIIEEEVRANLINIEKASGLQAFVAGIDNLAKINIHYQKKEILFFPYMEKYGITAPPKVMWGVDDEIRNQIKEVKMLVTESRIDRESILEKVEMMITNVTEMIFKEENILVPMILEKLTQDEWNSIAAQSEEIGYMVHDVTEWKDNIAMESISLADNKGIEEGITKDEQDQEEIGLVHLPTGVFHVEELTSLFNTLPFDITFVNKDDVVKYFSEGKERTFPRTKSIIGRNVSNCHPPASVHIVEKIVEDFKDGIKDQEDFWIKMGNKYILIRYYAVRSEKGEYLGVLEITQDIKPIQEITGEKRLVSE